MPKPDITVKTGDIHLKIPDDLAMVIAAFTMRPSRILPGDYEDNVRYEMVLQ